MVLWGFISVAISNMVRVSFKESMAGILESVSAGFRIFIGTICCYTPLISMCQRSEQHVLVVSDNRHFQGIAACRWGGPKHGSLHKGASE